MPKPGQVAGLESAPAYEQPAVRERLELSEIFGDGPVAELVTPAEQPREAEAPAADPRPKVA